MRTIYGLALAGALAVAPTMAIAASKDIVETATSAGTFGTLLQAAEKAGVVATLKGDGPYTLFAPTDEAFAKIDQAKLESLMKPENKEELTELLKHHVVPGKVLAIDIRNGAWKSLQTARGGAITVSADQMKIGNAKVVQSDIVASNGVIHVVDRVLDPQL